MRFTLFVSVVVPRRQVAQKQKEEEPKKLCFANYAFSQRIEYGSLIPGEEEGSRVIWTLDGTKAHTQIFLDKASRTEQMSKLGTSLEATLN
jgi:hypothetical protein